MRLDKDELEAYTLPWEKPHGKPQTCRRLFAGHPMKQVRARSYSETLGYSRSCLAMTMRWIWLVPS